MIRRRSVLLGPAAALWGCASRSPVSPPAAEDTPEWTAFALPGKRETRYVPAHKEGRPCWHAQADASASMLRRQFAGRSVAGVQAGFSWWVPRTIMGADLSHPDSSDSPARVAFAFTGDMARLSARNRMQFQMVELLTGEMPPYATLMYVWANQSPLETIHVSGRTDRVRKIVVESGESNLQRWCSYRRNLAEDFRRAFGEDPGLLSGIGLMTDADNTGSTAEAWYGEVVLRPAA